MLAKIRPAALEFFRLGFVPLRFFGLGFFGLGFVPLRFFQAQPALTPVHTQHPYSASAKVRSENEPVIPAAVMEWGGKVIC
jgi:hypothetical protein